MKTFLLFFIAVIGLLPAKAQVVLNEVYTDPGSGNQEFFELYNTRSSQTAENLDNYTLVTYYEESGKSGFYVLDFPNLTINPRNFFVSSSLLNFNVQGQSNLLANANWNLLNTLPLLNGALSKWENTGLGAYLPKLVPLSLSDLFVKKSGSGAAYSIFIFKNGILINGLIGGSSTNTIPSFIKAMPNLPVDMLGASPDFTINFSSMANNQVEYVIAVPGTDNGYIRTADGKCGSWTKSSSGSQHTPGASNGSAVGQTGDLTITSYITPGATPADPSYLYYKVTAGPADAFPATIEAYKDMGIIGQLDANDVLIDSRQIASVSTGLQQVLLPGSNDQVMLIAKSPAGCFDKVNPVLNNRSVLPVKLEFFNAVLNNNKTDLKWTTLSEINISHFIIEKSLDGKSYSDAGVVFAYGNATDKTNYVFSDNINGAFSGVLYYRLRSVENDGKSEYSQVRIVRVDKLNENKVSILTFPNPVNDKVRISIPNNWQNKKVTYELFNINGQSAGKMETTNSSQTETMYLSNLAPGLYVLKVNCEGQNSQQKIIKQ